MITDITALEKMDAQALRSLARQLLETVGTQSKALDERAIEIKDKELKIAQLTHEMALHRRWRFDKRSEQFKGLQGSLFEETIDADLAAMQTELEDLVKPEDPKQDKPRTQPKRNPLPAELPRTDIFHEPAHAMCGCGCALKRIGQDVSEKLHYTPGVFTVERHIRGRWACAQCELIIQQPVPAQVIDKSYATPALLAHLLISKFADHLPLYRLEQIYGRAGLAIPRSTLSQWVGICGVRLQPLVDALRQAVLTQDVLHADETPVKLLKPGQGKTHKAYLWAYASGRFEPMQAVIYEFSENRSGENAKTFLNGWKGRLVCDYYSGYQGLFGEGKAIIEIGCLAHARRKFHDLYEANKSEIAQQALTMIGFLYDVEHEARDMTPEDRGRLRQQKVKPILRKMRAWLVLQRTKATDGTALARALDYSIKRWGALTRYVEDGRLPIDNNHLETRIRPVATGRNNWQFMGSTRAGKRAAAIMSLVQSAKLNGLDPYAYLVDVLERLPTHPNQCIQDLLPQNWKPQAQS